MEKGFLYLGYYYDTQENYLLKIGTTCNLARRSKEHTRNYQKAKKWKMLPDEEFHYIWYREYSKYNLVKYETATIQKWKKEGMGIFVRNDRFFLEEIPKMVKIVIRKEHEIKLDY